jgi:hypothetical protein
MDRTMRRARPAVESRSSTTNTSVASRNRFAVGAPGQSVIDAGRSSPESIAELAGRNGITFFPDTGERLVGGRP